MPLCVLRRHPDTPCTAVERVEVAVERAGRRGLQLTYRIVGDASRIVAPPAGAPPRRRDELWRHTCCELFVRDGSGSGYREYNFAPCGDWAAYRFNGYRAGMAPLDVGTPQVALERSPGALTLIVTVTDRSFQALGAAQRIGIACVVETDADVSYWALAHPPGRPDFHHDRAFALLPPIEHTAHLTR